jgi:MFS family permease
MTDLLVLRRRFVLLTFLRWFPIGLVLPVLVLMPRARGVSLPTVGVLFAAYGATTLLLELPSGSLSDVIGRRAVLLASGVLTTLGMAVFAFGQPVWVLLVGMLLKGAGRALDSGPLESWYVDSAHRVDRAADLKPALARSAAACGVALAAGSLAGGALVVVAPLPETGRAVVLTLSVPYLCAMAFGVLSLLFVAAWVNDTVAAADRRPTWRSVVRDVPRTVAAGSRLAAASPVLRRLGARSAAFGAVITAVEVLSPVQFGESAGAGAYSALVTVAFLGTAAGARLGPAVARLLGGSDRALLVSTCLAAAGLACLALPWWWGAAVAYVAFYAVLGVDDPIAGELLHAETGPEQRATLLSVQSLLMMGGGLVGNLAVPRLAASSGLVVSWLVVAGAALASALLTVGLPSRVPADVEHDDLAPPSVAQGHQLTS